MVFPADTCLFFCSQLKYKIYSKGLLEHKGKRNFPVFNTSKQANDANAIKIGAPTPPTIFALCEVARSILPRKIATQAALNNFSKSTEAIRYYGSH